MSAKIEPGSTASRAARNSVNSVPASEAPRLTQPISFTVPGKPSGKGRPRFVNGHVYSPDVGNFQARVATFAVQAGLKPVEGPIAVGVYIYRRMPNSWSKRRKALMPGLLAVGKPDIANVVCACHDGLTGVAYFDDQQVSKDMGSSRVWAEEDKTIISVCRTEGI
jgi:Holliday junction resolvase RusA-like endonuclease